MKKRLLFYTHFPCWPCEGGRHRATFEVLTALVAAGTFDITVVVFDEGNVTQREKLASMGVRLVEIGRIGMNHPLNILQRVVNKLSMSVLTGFFVSFFYRRQMAALIRACEAYVINGTMWFPLLPKRLRKRAMMITYDLLYQRKASHLTKEQGRLSLWQRAELGVERALEVFVLRQYGVAVVLAEYEEQSLLKAGMERERILRIGMPIRVQAKPRRDGAAPRYDFVFLGTAVDSNIEGVDAFFARILPLLEGRTLSIAVAGSLGKDGVWEKYVSLPNLKIDRLGFVDDLGALMATSCVGIASVPWGSGVKVKVVEMAMHHLPLVVTNCAMEGIPLTGPGFVNMDTATDDELRAKIVSWLDDPTRAAKEGLETGRVVEEAFRADVLLKPLVEWL